MKAPGRGGGARKNIQNQKEKKRKKICLLLWNLLQTSSFYYYLWSTGLENCITSLNPPAPPLELTNILGTGLFSLQASTSISFNFQRSTTFIQIVWKHSFPFFSFFEFLSPNFQTFQKALLNLFADPEPTFANQAFIEVYWLNFITKLTPF